MTRTTTATKKKTKAKTTKKSSSSYDNIPYASYPFAQTNPALLNGIANIFGMEGVNPEKARILEIGCASGNNILGIADIFPGSTCVGIDYSEKQIEEGNLTVKELGLKNVKLKHLSVVDIDKDFGTFDYIICHGVLSWVPADVREHILRVCDENLSKDGIAYVSYNTLPGWNSVRSAREMMLYHTENFKEPAEKVQAARQILQFIGNSMRSNGNPAAAVMDRELEILNTQTDAYLLHEHLEDNNHQFYFHEFMSLAQKNNLQYLAETSLEKMFIGNFDENIAKVLQTSNDIVRTEQYMDYIYDRRFRSTLLCHKDRILNRNINSEKIASGYIAPRFNYPENFAAYDLKLKQSLKFAAFSGMEITTDDQVVQATLQVMCESQGEFIAVDALINATKEKLAAIKHPLVKEADKLKAAICEYVVRFLFVGGTYYMTTPAPHAAKVAKKPIASKMCRLQAIKQSWVNNKRLENVTLSPFDKKLIPLLDGTRDIEALSKELMPTFESKELAMNESEKPVTDMNIVKERLPKFIENALHQYTLAAIMVEK